MLELIVVKPCVDAALFEQLLVTAALRNAVGGEDYYLVGVFNGGKTVGNYKGGPVLGEAVHSLLNEHFGAGVNGGGGFVKYQHGAVLQHCAGYREQLLLSGGYVAVVGKLGVIALGQGVYKVLKSAGAANLVKPAVGNEVALSTIQLDFLLPRRFELTYVDEAGVKQTPVVIHRAILGSLDRFIAFLLEETKGRLPLWLAPQQFAVIPVNPNVHTEYAAEVTDLLNRNGFRAKLDDRNEKLGYRIREAQVKKVSVQLVIGDKEIENRTITMRRYNHQESETYTLDEFIALVKAEVDNKELAK